MKMSVVTVESGDIVTSVIPSNEKVCIKFGSASCYISVSDIPDFITDLQKCFWVAVQPKQEEVTEVV